MREVEEIRVFQMHEFIGRYVFQNSSVPRSLAIYLINSGRPIIPSSPQKTRVVHGLVHQNLRHIHLNC